MQSPCCKRPTVSCSESTPRIWNPSEANPTLAVTPRCDRPTTPMRRLLMVGYRTFLFSCELNDNFRLAHAPPCHGDFADVPRHRGDRLAPRLPLARIVSMALGVEPVRRPL